LFFIIFHFDNLKKVFERNARKEKGFGHPSLKNNGPVKTKTFPVYLFGANIIKPFFSHQRRGEISLNVRA